jgi:hypothetical protein
VRRVHRPLGQVLAGRCTNAALVVMTADPIVEVFLWSVVGLVLTVFLVWGVRRGRGASGAMLKVADWITISRLVLIAPTAWLLARHHFIAAALCYVLLGLTDIVDGIVARARHETSAFGTFLDPLADILSTFAVFTVFLRSGFIPPWLYALMLLRYLPLAAASLVLTRRFGPRATVLGSKSSRSAQAPCARRPRAGMR